MIRNLLKKYLFDANMSQQKLGDLIDTDRVVVNGVCNGNRIFDYHILLKVCNVLGCTPEDIYDDDVLDVIYSEVKR